MSPPIWDALLGIFRYPLEFCAQARYLHRGLEAMPLLLEEAVLMTSASHDLALFLDDGDEMRVFLEALRNVEWSPVWISGS